LFSPQAIAIQVAGIVLLIVLVLTDWPSVIDKLRAFWAARRGRPAPTPIRQTLTELTPAKSRDVSGQQ
jgi:hypothetical protein